MDAVDALTQLGGVARLKDLLKLTSRSRVRTAEAAGRLRRVGPGRYALPTAKPALESAARLGGYASHLCAAAELGWEIARQPETPQVVIRRSTPSPVPGIGLSTYPLVGADTRGLVTGPALTVLLCARDLPFDEALAVADSCLRHGDLDHDELVAAAAAWPDHVREVVERADARAANPFESVLRALAIRAGLDVIPQYEVRALGSLSTRTWPIPCERSSSRPTHGASMPHGRSTTVTVCDTTRTSPPAGSHSVSATST